MDLQISGGAPGEGSDLGFRVISAPLTEVCYSVVSGPTLKDRILSRGM